MECLNLSIGQKKRKKTGGKLLYDRWKNDEARLALCTARGDFTRAHTSCLVTARAIPVQVFSLRQIFVRSLAVYYNAR